VVLSGVKYKRSIFQMQTGTDSLSEIHGQIERKWAKLVFQTLGMAIGSFLPSVCQGFLGSLEEMLWEGHWL